MTESQDLFQKLASPTPDDSGRLRIDLSGATLDESALIQALADTKPNNSVFSLDLGGTKATDVVVGEAIRCYPCLQSLNLRNTNVTDHVVKSLAGLCDHLMFLSLSNTNVTDKGVIELAACCSKLQSLVLRRMTVTHKGVMALASSCELQAIDLSGTHMTDMEARTLAEHCPRLRCLYVWGTQMTIEGVAAVIVQCEKLEDIGFQGTEVADDEMLRSMETSKHVGSGYVGFIRELQRLDERHKKEGPRRLNEAKVIVMGNEAVGKSSLVEFLLHDRPLSDKTKTDGVRIHDHINVDGWDPETKPEEEPLRLNLWDFGGQEVLYETHKMFITGNSLYLIVLEARRANTDITDEDVLHDRMRDISDFIKETPFIVVVNKAEKAYDLQLQMSELKKDYPTIQAIVRTSCEDLMPSDGGEGGKGIAELRQKIIHAIRKQIPHLRGWVSAGHSKARETVRDQVKIKFVLTMTQYREICDRNDVANPQEQRELLQTLGRLGVVVARPDKRGIESFILHDPCWLTTAVYRVLMHPAMGESNGEFGTDDLGEFLRDIPDADKKYTSDWWPYIVDHFVESHLCFPIPGQPGRYLMPQRLPTKEPALNFNMKGSLRFRYDYKYPPRGLLSRFIVQMHRHLSPERIAWAAGVVITVEQCRVLVRADLKNRRILVFIDDEVNGHWKIQRMIHGLTRKFIGVRNHRLSKRQKALRIIHAGFTRVHDLFKQLDPTPMVPIDVPGQPDAACAYDQLVSTYQQGLPHIVLPGTGMRFRAKDLLDFVGLELTTKEPTDVG